MPNVLNHNEERGKDHQLGTTPSVSLYTRYILNKEVKKTDVVNVDVPHTE